MKANAPEKIYLQPSEIKRLPYQNIFCVRPLSDNSIEYIRKDAFIEKAIKYIANHFLAPEMNNEIEDFVNYMKGE